MSGKIVLCSWIKRVNIIKIGSSQVIFVNLIDPSKTTGQPPLGRLQLLRATSPLPGSPYPVRDRGTSRKAWFVFQGATTTEAIPVPGVPTWLAEAFIRTQSQLNFFNLLLLSFASCRHGS